MEIVPGVLSMYNPAVPCASSRLTKSTNPSLNALEVASASIFLGVVPSRAQYSPSPLRYTSAVIGDPASRLSCQRFTSGSSRRCWYFAMAPNEFWL